MAVFYTRSNKKRLIFNRVISVLIILLLITPQQGFAQIFQSGSNENLTPFYISQIMEVLDENDAEIESLSEDKTPSRARPDYVELAQLFGERAGWFKQAWVRKVAECTARDIVSDVREKCGDVHTAIIKDILIQRMKVRALEHKVPDHRRDVLIAAIERRFPAEQSVERSVASGTGWYDELISGMYPDGPLNARPNKTRIKRRSPASGSPSSGASEAGESVVDRIKAEKDAIQAFFSQQAKLGVSYVPSDQGLEYSGTDMGNFIEGVIEPLTEHLTNTVMPGMYSPETEPDRRGFLVREKDKAFELIFECMDKDIPHHGRFYGLLIDALGYAGSAEGAFRDDLWEQSQLNRAYVTLSRYYFSLESLDLHQISLMNSSLLPWLARIDPDNAEAFVEYAADQVLSSRNFPDLTHGAYDAYDAHTRIALAFKMWGALFTKEGYAHMRRGFFRRITRARLIPIDVRSLLDLAADENRKAHEKGNWQLRKYIVSYLITYFQLHGPFNDQELTVGEEKLSVAVEGQFSDEVKKSQAPLDGFILYVNSIQEDWEYFFANLLYTVMFKGFRGTFGLDEGAAGPAGADYSRLRELSRPVVDPDDAEDIATHGPDLPGFIRLEVHMYPTPFTATLIERVLEYELTGDPAALLEEMSEGTARHPHAHIVRDWEGMTETPYQWLEGQGQGTPNILLGTLCAGIANRLGLEGVTGVDAVRMLADPRVTGELLSRCLSEMAQECSAGTPAEKREFERINNLVHLYRLLLEVYGPQSKNRAVANLQHEAERSPRLHEMLLESMRGRNVWKAAKESGQPAAFLETDNWPYWQVDDLLSVAAASAPAGNSDSAALCV
ncbi:hypothetical protein ACFL42_04010, partial [Candidatus Omnitrophota bacterium]